MAAVLRWCNCRFDSCPNRRSRCRGTALVVNGHSEIQVYNERSPDYGVKVLTGGIAYIFTLNVRQGKRELFVTRVESVWSKRVGQLCTKQ